MNRFRTIGNYLRAKRAMKALFQIVENPDETVKTITQTGDVFRDSLLILQGKEPPKKEQEK